MQLCCNRMCLVHCKLRRSSKATGKLETGSAAVRKTVIITQDSLPGMSQFGPVQESGGQIPTYGHVSQPHDPNTKQFLPSPVAEARLLAHSQWCRPGPSWTHKWPVVTLPHLPFLTKQLLIADRNENVSRARRTFVTDCMKSRNKPLHLRPSFGVLADAKPKLHLHLLSAIQVEAPAQGGSQAEGIGEAETMKKSGHT
jgi:hypothetical protein